MNIKNFILIYNGTKTSLLLLFLLFVSMTSLEAQKENAVSSTNAHDLLSNITIRGKVIDKTTKIPLQFGTITLYNLKDSLVLTGNISDEQGTFLIKTQHKNFFIKIEFIAYQALIIDTIEFSNTHNQIDLGLIELVTNTNMMAEVEIRAEKSSVMMNLDKRVFNVGKDLTSTGGTAEDVLRNVPGISVGIDGNFNLRGSDGVRLLLNGRASALVSNENLSGLRQIQANQIERIEVITNPSARYEAEGLVGIINIILKKKQTKGSNGSINLNVGNPENYGLGLNVNYQKDKLNGFIGVGGWWVARPGTGSFRNEFYKQGQPDSTIFSNMDRTHERRNLLGYINFGVNYHFNSKNILMTSFSFRKVDGKNTSKLIYTDALGQAQHVFLITQRLEQETEEEADMQYALIYKKLFEKKGHQLTTDIQYENKSEKETSIYEELYFDGAYMALDTADYKQFSNSEEGNRRLGINIDYVLPMKKQGKLEGGIQSSFRKIFNDYRVRELLNNIENPNIDFTNDFNYDEIIHALYVNLGQKINHFSFQTGLRMEYSDVKTKLLVTNEINPRKYTNLFPSIFLTYDLPVNNAVQLSYSRRIQRPTFLDLNPFFTLRDRRNIFRGNPNIEPEYTDSYELGHIKYWEKGSLSSVAYFRKTKNVIKRLQRLDQDFPDVTITQAENLELKRNFGVEFTYSYFPNKWWRLNGDMNLFHSLAEGTFEYKGETFFVGGESFSMTTKTSSRFIFWKKINTQITFNYSAPRTTTQGGNKAIIAADFAVGMDFFNNNGSLTLSVIDMFNSRRRRSFSADDTFYSEDNFLWQSRAIVLSFHYRFNQQKERNRIYTNPLKEEEEEAF